ncbi:MAG TPA: copper resistance protein CopC [Caulobacteraceae bacterium]|jgi:methionine-rich copper-binding protein CopC
MTLSLVVRGAGLGVALAVLSLAVLSLAALPLSAAQAAGPLQVVSRNPAKDGFTAFPKQIHLTFNGPLKATGAEVQLLDPDGRRIRLAGPSEARDGLTVTPELTGEPAVEGPYELSWQADSASGAHAQGRYTFFVQ